MRPTEVLDCVRVAHSGVGRIVNAAAFLTVYPGERRTSTNFLEADVWWWEGGFIASNPHRSDSSVYLLLNPKVFLVMPK